MHKVVWVVFFYKTLQDWEALVEFLELLYGNEFVYKNRHGIQVEMET